VTKLTRSFYARASPEVARELLSKVLVRRIGDTMLKGRIVEVEAYTGATDPGSHAFRGPTRRNRVMFGPPGYVYVYVIYAVHFCMNVVAETEGVAGAILLRALEPLAGIQVMERSRGGRAVPDLCSGPAKLCQAYGITTAQDGVDLTGDEIWIEDDGDRPQQIDVSTRVGLTKGTDLPLRFYLPNNRFVSRGKPSPPRPISQAKRESN
jgi:DNA-3-methyladenine glycosylase